jgi:hypothetical protein
MSYLNGVSLVMVGADHTLCNVGWGLWDSPDQLTDNHLFNQLVSQLICVWSLHTDTGACGGFLGGINWLPCADTGRGTECQGEQKCPL